MALALYDRVQETGTANTTVSFTLSGAVAGFQSFSVIGNGNTTYYSATDSSGNWEVGLGTYSTSGPTLTRTTIYSSSNAGAAVTFSGTVTVFVTYPAGNSVVSTNNPGTSGYVLTSGGSGVAPTWVAAGGGAPIGSIIYYPSSTLTDYVPANGTPVANATYPSLVGVLEPFLPTTQRTLPVSANWYSIAWNGTVFCAVASGSAIAATSPDGITWTQRTLPVSANWRSIAWNGTVFCAVAYNSTIAATISETFSTTLLEVPNIAPVGGYPLLRAQ
jgi:hypothetical protein